MSSFEFSKKLPRAAAVATLISGAALFGCTSTQRTNTTESKPTHTASKPAGADLVKEYLESKGRNDPITGVVEGVGQFMLEALKDNNSRLGSFVVYCSHEGANKEQDGGWTYHGYKPQPGDFCTIEDKASQDGKGMGISYRVALGGTTYVNSDGSFNRDFTAIWTSGGGDTCQLAVAADTSTNPSVHEWNTIRMVNKKTENSITSLDIDEVEAIDASVVDCFMPYLPANNQ